MVLLFVNIRRKWCFSFHQGIDSEDGHIQLITEVIHKILGIDMSALMGANIAMDVAKRDFCEATIGG